MADSMHRAWLKCTVVEPGCRRVLEAAITVFLVVGFLYSLQLPPIINSYYFVDPYKSMSFTRVYVFTGTGEVLEPGELLRKLALCLEEAGDFIVFIGSDGASFGVASSPEALKLAFSDIDVGVIGGRLRGVDGVLVDVASVKGYELSGSSVGRMVTVELPGLCRENTSVRLLVVRSRSTLMRGLVPVLVGAKYLDELCEFTPIELIVGGRDKGSVGRCINSTARLSVRVSTRDEAYMHDRQVVARMGAGLRSLAIVLAVAVVARIGFREGAACAKSMCTPVKPVRLHGSKAAALTVGAVLGLVLFASAALGMVVLPYLYHAVLVGALMPPWKLVFTRTLYFIVPVLSTSLLAPIVGSLLGARK